MLYLHEFLCFFTGWDADFATEAYRQQVETLAQHQVRSRYSALLNLMFHLVYSLPLFFLFITQLMEDLEYEAKRKEEEEAENDPTR